LRKILCRLAEVTLRDPVAVDDMELAFGEAFGNAVKYGEKNAKICVRVEAVPEYGLSIEMAYPGSQFNTTVTYPSDVKNANGGFGRFIMKQLVDSLEYSFDGGFTTVRMTRHR
jgi:anti-sigma regulatory factor (Ser/Thr protein kinase)